MAKIYLYKKYPIDKHSPTFCQKYSNCTFASRKNGSPLPIHFILSLQQMNQLPGMELFNLPKKINILLESVQ